MRSTRNCAVELEKSVCTAVLDNLHSEVCGQYDNCNVAVGEWGLFWIFPPPSTATLRHRGVKNVVPIILYHSNVVRYYLF